MYGITIIETSFPIAWQRAVMFVRKSPMRLNFGGRAEKKKSVDSGVEIILDHNAVKDVLNHITHPSDPFATPNKLKEYLKEYTPEFNVIGSGFDYTYRDKLIRGFSKINANTLKESYLNQIDILKNGLQKQIDEQLSSNRNIAILFNPLIENFSEKSTPCWNEVLIRLEDDNKVSIHTLFRSHDLFGAWESNMIAIVTMLNEEIIKPCGCEISFVKEHNFSMHIYDYDLPQANTIKIIPRNPMLQRLQEKYDNIK